ncbi:phenylalanine--tRNA ligase subunit beta [Candidatus Kaiserbacteria bacterium]|nr:phenylalanine--tRNA ligase subunit beta [Candidatus Kaiserbacteria bacterium]
MKVSLKWLQNYFDTSLPKAEIVADAFTFHAFEIEESTGDLMDIKVLPNRAANCLCHRGIASELSAILDIPLKSDPLREALPAWDVVRPTSLSVEIEDPKKCLRYMGALVRNVKVRPSPSWLKEALETIGQRSINNIVDATNYVMLNVGQPLHAFDAARAIGKEGRYVIGVRASREGEKIITLTGEEYTLPKGTLLITDAQRDAAIGIAGVKGGKAAEVTAATTDIIVESANFDGTSVRRTAQALKLFTEASARFQNRPHLELAAYGMRDALALITEIAGGEVVGVVDEYPASPPPAPAVSVSLGKINRVLGAVFSREEVKSAFVRLGLETKTEGETFIVAPPFERTDLAIPEDLVEEVGRLIGYDRVPATELPPIAGVPDQARYRGVERMKDQLVEQGFTEVSTQSFAPKGDVLLANPLDKNMPALRTSLEDNLNDALARAKQYSPLVLAPNQKPKLFEVGTVFPKEGEYLELRMTERIPEWGDAAGTVDNLSIAKLEDYGTAYEPKRPVLGVYRPFSAYPFMTRDIALWVPPGADDGLTKSIIRKNARGFLVRLDQFDRFEKEGRVSLAFHLVFQSTERTLTDEEINGTMERVSGALKNAGYEVR